MSTNEQNNTRLYLNVPTDALDEMAATRQLLDRLSNSLDIACVNLALGNKGSGAPPTGDENLKGLIGDLQQKNIAVLADLTDPLFMENRKSFEKVLEKCVNMRCDGVHLSAEIVLFERAKEVLHEGAIIGCDCSMSKHQAMQLGELGADYIAFHATDIPPQAPDIQTNLVELVSWWQELFEIPCVATDIVDLSEIENLLLIPADFIAIGATLFETLGRDEKLLASLVKKFPLPEKAS